MATVAAVMGALSVTTFAAVDTNSTSTTSTTSQTSQVQNRSFRENIMMDTQIFGDFGGPRGGQFGPGSRALGGMGGILVSSEYLANVNVILNNDTDVASLISEGYNVTAIHPVVETVIQGDGALTAQATTAVVLMANGTSGHATVTVDVANAQVIKITTVTRAVIDKSRG